MKKLMSLLLVLLIANSAMTAFADAMSIANPDDASIDDIVARVKAVEVDYSYDDMSVPYTIDIITSGNQADPFPENDPVKDWFKEKLNVELKVTSYINAAEKDQQIVLRYSSDNPPDLAYVSEHTAALKLYKQGLLLNDVQKYLDKMPTYTAQMHKFDIVTRIADGNMFSLSSLATAECNHWQTWIRKDWLDKLHLEMPRNTEDLLEVARRFTFDDPDGNGIDDTWGFSDCAEGGGMSWLSCNMSNIFGMPEVDVIDGKVVPMQISPKYRKALGFVSQLVSEKTIDPDWYTQDWLACYNKIRAGQIGIIYMWMPGAMTVLEGGAGSGANPEPNRKANGEVWEFEDWALLESDGYLSTDTWNKAPGDWIVSAQVEADEGKLNRLLHYIDYMTTPNEGGNVTSYMGQAGGILKKVGIGVRGDYSIVEPICLNNYRSLVFGGFPVNSKFYGTMPWFTGDEPEFQKKVMAAIDVVNALPTFTEYSLYVTTPTEMISMFTDLMKFTDQNQIDFILGNRSLDEWNAYVDEYLNDMQGQQLIDAYTQQLTSLDFIK